MLHAKVVLVHVAICKGSSNSYIQRFCWQLYTNVLVVAIYKCSRTYIHVQWFQRQLYAKVLVVAVCKGSSGSLYAKVLVVAYMQRSFLQLHVYAQTHFVAIWNCNEFLQDAHAVFLGSIWRPFTYITDCCLVCRLWMAITDQTVLFL